jgi:cleavage and polyadenylation specificity factor subunit 3
MSTEELPLGTKRRLVLLDGASAGDTLEIIPLGAGQEVGRSGVILKFRGRTIMFDCGIHPAFTGMTALPYFDSISDWSEIDLCLITHFHLDHSGAVPYLIGRSEFRGEMYMTHPNKPICKLLWQDYARVSKISAEENIYSKADIDLAMNLIKVCGFSETVILADKGISFTAYRAGHVLGGKGDDFVSW